MRLRHPYPLPLSVWQSEIAIDNRDRIRPNRLNPIVLPWQSRWNRRFDRIIGNTGDNSSQDSSKTAKRPPSFMRMNQFGPWDTTISEHMKQLGHIVLAFTIQQSLRETKSEFGQLLDTEVGKAKDRRDDDWFEKGIRSLRIT